MTLSEVFTAWLEAEGDRRGAADPVIAALDAGGYAPEARLLAAYAERGPCAVDLPGGPAPWDGRRAHVGPALPAAAAGELWLDTVELSLMALLPGDPIEQFAPEARHRWSPHRHWFALRAAAGWQYAGFLAAAPIERARGALALLDPARSIPDPERAPVLSAAPLVIAAYRGWFGKRAVDRYDWLDAARLFGPDAAASLWTPGAREWTGGRPDLDVDAAIEPDEIELDDADAFDAEEESPPAPGERRFFGPLEIPPGGAAFRSTVDPRDGLRAGPVELPGISIRERARR